MGIPVVDATTITQAIDISPLPMRAYQHIYNEYFRDQNVTPEVTISSGAVTTFANDFPLRKRAWGKDYFTSALPWTQRGAEVTIPIEGDIDFVPDYRANTNWSGLSMSGDMQASSGDVEVNSQEGVIQNLTTLKSYALQDGGLTINDLRESVALQKWLENNARGGGRYIEQIFSHFGVISSDARLQRPEFLGGMKTNVVISETLATAETGSTVDVGDMYGHGISVGGSRSIKHYAEEHGYIISVLSILPRTAYQQGIDKDWLKTDKLEFGWPEFGHLGEQPIKQAELYYDITGTDKDDPVGS
jgi:hypothetical protein